MSFNVKKFIVIFALVWLVILMLFIFLFQRTEKEANPVSSQQTMGQVNNPSPEKVESGNFGENVDINKVVGTWVSNRNPKTLLVLSDDMTYQDDIWLGSGTFKINGPYILLSGEENYGNKPKVLKYQEDDGEKTLFFTIDKYSTTFKPATEDDVHEVESFSESDEGQNELPQCDGLFEPAYEILSTYTWTSDDGSVSFHDSAFTIKRSDGTSSEFQYEVDGNVEGAEGDPYVYTIPVTIKDSTGAVVGTEPMKLYTGADGFFVYITVNGTSYEYSCDPNAEPAEEQTEISTGEPPETPDNDTPSEIPVESMGGTLDSAETNQTE